jgi:hypothetical protein
MDIEQITPFGRAEADGSVYLRLPDGTEKLVGQYTIGTPEEGLAFFARKYLDLWVELDLTEQRIKQGKADAATAGRAVAKVREALVDPAFVGDVVALEAKLTLLDSVAEAEKEAAAERRKAERHAALAKREALVTEAESLATSTQWKATGDRYRELLDEWKALPAAPRAVTQPLWERFSAARSQFDKTRRHHFASLDAQRTEALQAKEALVAEAEALATSTDWNATAAAYRTLMDRWKAAPRGARPDEQRLWAKFKAAQDTFFAARTASFSERDAAQSVNVKAKLELLAEAEALDVTSDWKGARKKLRDIQERWEAAGQVPRADREKLEARFRKVEDSVRKAQENEHRRTDPEKSARASATVELLRASVNDLEAQAAKATDPKRVAELKEAADGRRELLAAAEAALKEFQA